MSSKSILARQSKRPLALNRETIRNLHAGIRIANGAAPSDEKCSRWLGDCTTTTQAAGHA